ncbi:MAG: helix-turn-helix domain-containing protein [Flavobacteriaceae bacterium]|nr:helix-turn-helix domain-containing protein [Flavobacteriaceae bacterium]NNL80371.1 helix-turn-helix domain-containing protein [Flavobacteriaceae bacterium]
MKILPFQIPKPGSLALIYQEDKGELFYDKYHQHSEIQISYIVSGEGTMIIGDTVSPYKEGDIIVIGGGLPHVLKTDSAYGKPSFMQSLFFNMDSFGSDFFNLEEMKSLKSFFKKSENGFKAMSNLTGIRSQFGLLPTASQFERFVLLLKILNMLSRSRYQTLSGFIPKGRLSNDDGNRISDVMSYSIEHFREHISLGQVSEVASMSKNAFCRYFKKRTNKTYIQFLNELRVEQASKLLLSRPDLTIAEIAEQCGFQNISNFNRQFKGIKNMTPSQTQKIS